MRSNLPIGWIRTQLSNISVINQKPSCSNLKMSDEVSFIPMQYVEALTGKVNLSETKHLKEVCKGYTSFRDGDILFAKITPCMENGKVAIVNNLKNGIGFGSTEFHVIRSPEVLPRKYFFFYLIQEGFRKEAQRHMTGSAGQLRVPKGFLEQIEIPLPPLAEQQRIVAKIEQLFSDLDAGVESLKAIKKQVRQYRQSVLKYAFEGKLTAEWRKKNKPEPASKLLEKIAKEKEQKTKGKKQKKLPTLDSCDLPELPKGWEWIGLGDLSESMKNGIYKPKQFYSDDGIACLRMYNIDKGKIIWKDIKRMTLTKEEVGEYGLNPNDLLVNRVNSRELVGKAAVIPDNLEKCVYESKNIRLRLISTRLCSTYVGYWFLFYAHRYFSMNAQQVVGMASINQDQIGAMPIPLMGTLEQEEIVSVIEHHYSIADKIEEVVNIALKQSNWLRQSILKQAFEGKLVPQDPTDEPADKLLERIRKESS